MELGSLGAKKGTSLVERLPCGHRQQGRMRAAGLPRSAALTCVHLCLPVEEGGRFVRPGWLLLLPMSLKCRCIPSSVPSVDALHPQWALGGTGVRDWLFLRRTLGSAHHQLSLSHLCLCDQGGFPGILSVPSCGLPAFIGA